MLKTNFENPQLETVSKIFKNFRRAPRAQIFPYFMQQIDFFLI